MEELLDLKDAMISQPEEDTPYLMFIDQLMAVSGCSQEEATETAAEYRYPARDVQRIKRALELAIGTHATARRIQWLAHRAVGRPIPIHYRLMITRGGTLPCTGLSPHDWACVLADESGLSVYDDRSMGPIHVQPDSAYILVGANWVLARACEQGFLSEPASRYDPEQDCE